MIGGLTQRQRTAVAVITAAVITVVLYDQLYIASSYNAIAQTLGVAPSKGANLLSLYFIFVGSSMVVAGRLAQVVGYARLLAGSMVLFAIGSAVALIPGPFVLLSLARIVVAIAAAGAVPTCFALVSECYGEGRARNRAFATLAAMVGVGGAVGALAGAAFGGAGQWRVWWVIPGIVMGLAAPLALKYLPKVGGAIGWQEFDVASAILTFVGLAGIMTAVADGDQIGWWAARGELALGPVHLPQGFLVTPLLFVISVLCLIGLYVRQKRRARRGHTLIIGSTLFRIRRFRIGVIVLMLMSLTSAGLLGAMPLFISYSFGSSAIYIGLHAFLVSLGIAVGGFAVAPLSRRMAQHTIVSTAIVLQIFTMLLMSGMTIADLRGLAFLLPYGLFGVSIGLGLGSLNNILLADVPDSDLSSGSSVAQTVANLASGLAVTIATLEFLFAGAAAVKIFSSGLNSGQIQALKDAAALQDISVNGFGYPIETQVSHGILSMPALQPLTHQVTAVVWTQFGVLAVVTIAVSGVSLWLTRKLKETGTVQPVMSGEPLKLTFRTSGE